MKIRSFCSGIGAPEQAWKSLGWTPLSHSEIDPQASAVLEHHHEGQNLGNLETISIDGDAGDLWVAGTPCQSFSVAGRRAGLDDPRGNLTLVFLRLLARHRPRWMVWENVPGVLSDDGGRTFGTILGLLGQCGYGFAYRVLDAQFVRVDSHARAVPQRRRRVFVVGYFGDWRRAAAVLLERASLRGDSAPRRTAGEGVAGTVGGGSSRRGWCDDTDRSTFVPAVAGTLQYNYADKWGLDNQHVDAGCPNFVVSHSLRSEGHDAGEDGTGRGTPITVGYHETGRGWWNGGAAGLRADPGGMPENVAIQTKSVRRITPLEAERLQGFPDGYTAVPYKGKPMSDAARYRMLGNSMAVNVMSWIGQRIAMVDAIAPPTPSP